MRRPNLTKRSATGRRGELGVSEKRWEKFKTCIVAPQSYLKSTSDAALYDCHLAYEAIRDWFRELKCDAARSEYRALLLNEAIEQNRRGYQPEPHEGVTKFWLQYWECLTSEFPTLAMKRPAGVPAGSDWPQFRPPELASGRRIVHKWAEGLVDLEIEGAGKLVDVLRAKTLSVLPSDMKIVRTGKSASVRIEVRRVDRFGDFLNQVEAVRLGLRAVVRLLSVSQMIEKT